jgi:hypothetical protein
MSKLPASKFERYGIRWQKAVHCDLYVELFCFLHDTRPENTGGRLSRLEHFWNAADIIWNNNPMSPHKLIRNEWSNRMVKGMIENAYCALAGCASSGKSHVMAGYGLICYLAAPTETKVLLTSTTLSAAQMRVWKSVSQLWLPTFPGKMVQSKCLIRGINSFGEISEETGLKLVPAAGSSDTEIDPGFIGIKAPRAIALLDELTDIPMGVLNACFTNLEGGKQISFELKAASNPNLYTDPFGVLCKPKDGWGSITEFDMEWETSRGICLRFDSEKSPNIVEGNTKYIWLPTQESIDMAKNDYGEKSRMFYRMYKAFWFADASDETVYSEGEIINSKADTPIELEEFKGALSQEVWAAGGDPAYTQGGDRFPVIIGRVVQLEGKAVLEVMENELIEDDVNTVHANRSYHAVHEMNRLCTKYTIDPENFGFDMTGAGIPFRDIVVSEWSSLPLGINFGGFASDLQISPVDKRLGKEVYANRVTEIWVRMKGLLREGRIRGLPNEIIEEICLRQWHSKHGGGGKMRIESKVEMKKRGMKSPDLADAFFCLLETVIRRGLMGEMENVKLDKRSAPAWEASARYFDVEMSSDLGLDYD